MYTEFKKLINVVIVLLVLSGIAACSLIFDNIHLLRFPGNRQDFLISSYLIASIPILHLIVLIFLKKVTEIVRVMDSNLSERLTELERKYEEKK